MSQPADLPHARAIIRPDGTAEVLLDGIVQSLHAPGVVEVRASLVGHVAERARSMGRSVRVDVDDPDGPVSLLVHPDGTVGEAPVERHDDDAPEADTMRPSAAAALAPPVAATPDAGPSAPPVRHDPASLWGPPGSTQTPPAPAGTAPAPPAVEPEAAPDAVAAPEQAAPAQGPIPEPAPADTTAWAAEETVARPPAQPFHEQPAAAPPAAGSTSWPAAAHAAPQPWAAPPAAPASPAQTPEPAPAWTPQQSQPDPQAAPSPQVQPAQQQPGQVVDWMREQGAAPPQTRRQMRESFLRTEQVEPPATRGVRGVLSRMGMKMQPSEVERSEREDIHAVSQHWPGVRTIAVVNGKGGASKTPTTALLAATFARFSGAATIAWDNNETRGTLGWRTEQGKHESTVLDLIPRAGELLDPTARAGDISHFVHHQAADKYDVLRSNPNLLSSEQRISADDVDGVHDVLGRYYRLIFVDSGNDESAGHWLQMISKADQLVVPTIARPEHAEAGALLLEALNSRGGHVAQLAQRAIVIVSQAREKDVNPSAAEIASGFSSWVPAVVTIPYDPAMVENVLRFDSLASSTQRAWLRAAAAVARQL